MGFEMRKKGRFKSTERFMEQIKEIQGETKAALAKAQKDMRKYMGSYRSEAVEYKVGDLVLLSTKDLKWQMIRRWSEKLTEYYIGPYKIKKVVFLNAVKLELPKTIKIHLVVNVSRIRMYLNQVPGQKAKVPKLVIIEGEKEWKVKRVLNKRKVWGKDKYLVCQRANSKPELSQLLFISIWQRELDRVSVRFSTLLIQLLHGLCTTFPCLSCDLSCDINVMWCCDLLSCGMTLFCTSFCVISPR